jgi:hypothetical protein
LLAWHFDLILLVALWRFGGFGAKLAKFKSTTLYDVVAMKLLETLALHFPRF